MTEEHDDVARYAAAVRAALADLPEPEREDLLEDLDSHLGEVAAESDEPLAERLGPSEEYAAELRAAYGVRSGRPSRRQRRARSRETAEAVRDSRAYRHVRGLLADLRPAWWVARGYLVAMGALLFFTAYESVIPVEFVPLLLVVLSVWVSVLLGRRAPQLSQGWRGAVLAGNALVVLLSAPLLSALSDLDPAPEGPVRPSAYGAAPPGGIGYGSEVTNIYPYSKDGEPLEDVLLYDQNGRPVVINQEIIRMKGLRSDYPTGADGRPVRNAYPITVEPQWPRATPQPTGRPRVAIPPFPDPSPTAPPTEEPSPTPTG